MNNKKMKSIIAIIRDIYIFLKNFQNILKFKLRFKESAIIWPLEIKFSNLNNIHISKNVVINHNLILRILDDCKLYIGKNTYIGSYSHIAGTKNKIIIGKDVLIADRVFISTVDYKYENINKPIKCQGFISRGDVIISDECWIGIGSSILSGIKIGKHSIIGANSVVTHNIPPYSVAVGVPARVIKKYNFNKKSWLSINEQSKVS